MFRLYFIIEAKIDRLTLRLSGRLKQRTAQPRLSFNFDLLQLNAALFVLEIIAFLVKFAIILLSDAGKGFAYFLRQCEANSCPYSYADYRRLQRRLRTFSLGGLMTLATASAVVGLILNLVFGGRIPGFAATFGWVQTKWDASPTMGYTALHDQASWGNSSTTAFEAKDSLVTINNPAPGDSFLSLSTTSSSITQTSDAGTIFGFNMPDAIFSQASTTGTATSTSLVLGISSTATFTLGGNIATTPSFIDCNGVYLDIPNNKIYVTESSNNSIDRFDSGTNGTTFGANFERYGTQGTGQNQFKLPDRIVVDPQYNIAFVSDYNNNKISYFNYSSTTIGSNFSSLSGFSQPTGLSIDVLNKKLFVADTNNNLIKVLDYTGSSLTSDKSFSSSTNAFNKPKGIAFVASTSKVYIADTLNNRLMSCNYNPITGTTSNWKILTGLNSPTDIVVDATLELAYVTNSGASTILMVDIRNDNMVASSTVSVASPRGLFLDATNKQILSTSFSGKGSLTLLDAPGNGSELGLNRLSIGDVGTGTAQYNTAEDIYVDNINYKIYVVDDTRIVRYDSGYGGTKLGENWQSFSSTTNAFRGPSGIFVDTNTNKIYISDKNRIIRFDTGKLNGTSFGSNWEETAISGTPTWTRDIYVDIDAQKTYFFVQLSTGKPKLKVFSSGPNNFGQDLRTFGIDSAGQFQFQNPKSISVDTVSKKIFITDAFFPKIASFNVNLDTGTTSDWHEYNTGIVNTIIGTWFDSRNNILYVGSDRNVLQVNIAQDGSFTDHTIPHTNSDPNTYYQGMFGDTINNKVFIIDNYYRIVRTDISATVNTYYSSGQYTSGAIDTGQNNHEWGLVSWDANTHAQTMNLEARSAASSSMEGATAWGTCAITNGQTLATNACINPGDRFVQYRVDMSTNYNLESPVLNDIGFNFNYYPSNQTLTSSMYDSGDAGNVLGAISWNENQGDAYNYASLSLRTGVSTTSASSSEWQTINLGTACTKTFGSGDVSCNFSQLQADMPGLFDGSGDQFFQYRINLLSPGDVAPTINSVNIGYVINITPEAEITNVPLQNTLGTVQVDYRIRDIDTNTGSTTGLVSVGLQYWNGGGWVTVSPSDFLIGSAIGSRAVDTENTTLWRDYSLVWLASSSFTGQYFGPSDGFKVRVTANDGEIANNTGYGTSSDFRLDTRTPLVNSISIDASANTGAGQAVNLTFGTIDDSAVEMRLGLVPDLSDAGAWSSFISTTSIILPTDPDTVYVQYKDAYQNISPIISATHSTAPTNEMMRDITNSEAEIFQEFIAWKKYTDPDFAKYIIFRSEDEGATYQQYATISSSTINYYFDTNFEFNGGVVTKKYYYRVAIENINGDRSHYNAILSDIPDGLGVDVNPPVISNVSFIATSTQTATILWDTNLESNSTVGYSTTPGDFTNIVGVATMRDNIGNFGQHRIVINGLSASTTYYFQVRSTDAFGFTVSQDKDGLDVPYSFTTQPGPVISNVSTSSVTINSATINWETSLPADSIVTYSASSSFANALQVTNSGTLELTHAINLENLSANTRYYYYVTSKDFEGYETIGRNFVNDEYVNYEFMTLADSTFPDATSTTCTMSGDSALIVQWQTEKPAISRIIYGLASGIYGSSTDYTSNFDTAQTALLSSLTASTTYFFQVINADQTNNISTSSEFSCETNEKLITEKQSQQQVQDAYNTGKVDGYVPPVTSSGGGGVLIVDKTDKVAPVISDVRVMDVSTTSAKIIWQTDENSSSFVEFGTTISYDSNWGRPAMTKVHTSEIRGLTPETVYHFRVSSADASGNLSIGEDRVIKTVSFAEELASHGSSTQVSDGNSTTSLREFIEKILASASLDGFDGSIISQYNLLEKLAAAMPAPIFTANPVAVTTMDSAMVTWQTDKDTNTLISLATADVYNMNKNKKDPYYRLEGEPYVFSRNHKLVLSDLKSGTTYHYQARSRAQLGLIAATRDFTFTTKDEGLAITNFNSEIKAIDQVTFKWLTNQETDAQLKFTPYHNNDLAVDEAQIVEERKRSKTHELVMKDLQPGTVYQVELSGQDFTGKKVSKTIPTFSTAKDTIAPEISQIQTESALSQGKNRTVQTIISWTTDEPTISEVTYEKGVSEKADLSEKAPIESSYGKRHVLVLTKFDPGQVYVFRIKATDSTGNTAVSDTHTILTPKQREGVFELILRNFETTFGWLKDINR